MSEYNLTHTGAELDEAISKVLDGYIFPEGSVSITENGEFDVTGFASAAVNVEGKYYASSLKPSSDTHSASFDIGFEPKLFVIALVNGFANNSTSTYYITSFWHCSDLTGAGYGEYSGGLAIYKNSSSQPAAVSYSAEDYYSCSDGVVTVNDTAHYFRSSTLYRVFAMA